MTATSTSDGTAPEDDADDADGSCDANIVETSPSADETSFYYRAAIVFELSAPD